MTSREYATLERKFKQKNPRYGAGAAGRPAGMQGSLKSMESAMANNTIKVKPAMARDMSNLMKASMNIIGKGLRDENHNCREKDAYQFVLGSVVYSQSKSKRVREGAFNGRKTKRHRNDSPN